MTRAVNRGSHRTLVIAIDDDTQTVKAVFDSIDSATGFAEELRGLGEEDVFLTAMVMNGSGS